jgi:hypothetical protein
MADKIMAELTKFESRTARLSCSAVDFFSFVTDIRNFEQFIPADTIRNWQSAEDECSFQVPPVGTVKVRISDRDPVSSVVFSGDALQKNDFELVVKIAENENRRADARLLLTADLNPFLKMMASGPIERFLETLVAEMEKFDKWDQRVKGSQPL